MTIPRSSSKGQVLQCSKSLQKEKSDFPFSFYKPKLACPMLKVTAVTLEIAERLLFEQEKCPSSPKNTTAWHSTFAGLLSSQPACSGGTWRRQQDGLKTYLQISSQSVLSWVNITAKIYILIVNQTPEHSNLLTLESNETCISWV